MRETTQEFEHLRQLALDHVWIPLRPWNVMTAPQGFFIFTEAKGCYVTDINGKTYLDYWGGVHGVNDVGWGRKEIADAVYEQIVKLHFPPTHELTVPKINLAKKLSDITPGSLSKVFFGNSGTESIEAAIAIAKKYQILSGHRNKHKIMGGYTYHGSTLGAKSTGWRLPTFDWTDFEPLAPGAIHVSKPLCSKCDFGLEYPSCDLLCARYIEKVINSEGPDTIAAFLDTPIDSDCFIPPPEYWPMVRSICDRYGILIIHDEVVTGFGRTGRMFGTEHLGIVPDITVLAKAFGSGYVPISAAVVTKEVAQKFEGGPREALNHSYTLEGHPGACVAALKNIEIIEREKLVENSAVMGKYLFEQLQSLYKHKIVGEVRGGLGLMCEVEFMKDRESKEPFTPEENARIRGMLKEKLIEAGLFGMFSNPLPIYPPLIITKGEVDEIVTGFGRVFGEIERAL